MILAATLTLLLAVGSSQGRHYGKEIGALSSLQHGVRGRLYAVDSRTLFLQDFHYDGVGPAAYFYVGTSKSPSASGATRLRDERGGAGPLRKYRGEGITLSLPEGKTLKDFNWFSVWCDDYSVNFGSVDIPRGLEYPKPVKVGALRGVHGVSSDPIVVVDAQTLLIPNFSYDGEAPDAKFWVGRGDKPSPEGIRIPDENGKETPLRKYDKKTIVLTLPGELTVFDIGHFGVWCEAFTVDFGHVVLPRAALAAAPPSLRMLGVSPQSRNKALAAAAPRAPSAPRARKPLARLDATTYRPQRLGAGPPASLDDAPAPSHLHRRADQPPQHEPTQNDQPTPNDQQQNEQSQQNDQSEQNVQNEQHSSQNDNKERESIANHAEKQSDDKYEIEIIPQTFTLLDPATQDLLTVQYLNEERRRALELQSYLYDDLIRQQREKERLEALREENIQLEQARLARQYHRVPFNHGQDYRFDLDPFGRSRL
ncbi:protein Skeletor, isoforms B/C isoform X3 [Zerene cesonia]|uniref:protein Skeletor, isoforms B/C isoform X3 n=1 Tax=Zerene cesonia TaxID=33412 RepID=UPI0018E5A0DE|nr:protein Skeletor, isoforms B/C isoform X3 [Zerene cesonia]